MALIFFNLCLIPVTCLFLSKHRLAARFGARFCLSYALAALVVHVLSRAAFALLFGAGKSALEVLYSLKYTLIAFAVSLLLSLALNLAPKGFFGGGKR